MPTLNLVQYLIKKKLLIYSYYLQYIFIVKSKQLILEIDFEVSLDELNLQLLPVPRRTSYVTQNNQVAYVLSKINLLYELFMESNDL